MRDDTTTSSGPGRGTARGRRPGPALPVPRVGTLALLLVGGSLAILALVTWPSVEAEPGAPTPLPFSAAPAEKREAYHVERSFVGRVEAARESRVGFELAGLVANVVADEGDRVDRGAPIARLDTARLEARRAELAAAARKAEARLALAEETWKRVQDAFARNALSTQRRDEARRERDAAVAALEAAHAALKSLDVDLDKSSLRSPFDAVVTRRFVDEGTVLSPGAPVVHLLERSSPRVRIGVAGPSIEALAEGQQHTLDLRGRPVDASIDAVLPLRDSSTRSVDVVFVLDARLDGIRVGDLATLRVERTIEEAGYWLPATALTESSRGLWACYVAEPLRADTRGGASHRLARRELELLHESSEKAFVRGTLAPGELVVLSGLHRAVPGLEVRVSRPTPRPAGDAAPSAAGVGR